VESAVNQIVSKRFSKKRPNDQKKMEAKCDDLIDARLEEHGISQEAVLGENGLIAQLKKRVVERALAGELTHHLGYAKGEAPEQAHQREHDLLFEVSNRRREPADPKSN
jgi:transposase-like protein